jgi:hypothetical protein
MATALLISTEQIKKFTILNGNLEVDEFIQYIKIAQDISIQNYIGTKLYDKYQSLIIDGELEDVGNEKYLELLTTHIQPMLIHYAMVHYLPFASYKVQNKGVFKHNSESATGVEKNEIDFLIEKERDIAEHYTQRFIKYMCENSTLFPEYTTNTGDDVQPDKDAFFSGWVL